MLGLEFPTRRPEIPLVRVQSERLLAGDRTELSKMLELMELDWDERWVARAGQLIDRWHHQTDRAFDPRRISRHQQTLRTARQLGYEPLDIDRAALDRRYKLAYHRAEERGPALGAYNFGILLEQCGDVEGAEAAYRRADKRVPQPAEGRSEGGAVGRRPTSRAPRLRSIGPLVFGHLAEKAAIIGGAHV